MCAHAALGQSIVLQHANVVNVVDGTILRDVTVVTRGTAIATVGSEVEPPADAQIVDASGKFLIPGLWDMHAHLFNPQASFHTLIANGITGVRDMYSSRDPVSYGVLRSLPDAVRMVVAGLIDGPGRPLTPGALVVRSPEEAKFAVQILVAQRADFIKVYSSLSREAFLAAADEGRRLGIPVVGHVPELVTPAEAAKAGMLSQEHLINILVSCSTREEELRAERAAMLANRELATMVKAREFGWPPEAGLLDTYDPKKAAELFETFADYGTWQAPTLAVSSYYAETPERTPELIMRAGLSGEELEKFRAHARRMLARYQELVGEMHRAGVLLLAGSDAGEATDVPMGAGLHRELELLVGSGLTPLEALQTATLNPAMYLGTLSLMGTIASGKVGDLVLLDANPLEDIRNTRKIRAVVMRGKLYTRETIDGWSVPNVQ